MIDWIDNNYQIISVTFGLCAALFVILRVSVMGLKSLVNYIEHEQRNKLNMLKQVYAAKNGEVIKRSN